MLHPLETKIICNLNIYITIYSVLIVIMHCVFFFLTGHRRKHLVIETLLSHPTRAKVCAVFSVPQAESMTLRVRCAPAVSGDRVRIKLRSKGVLSLCEVEVYGFPSKIYQLSNLSIQQKAFKQKSIPYINTS